VLAPRRAIWVLIFFPFLLFGQGFFPFYFFCQVLISIFFFFFFLLSSLSRCWHLGEEVEDCSVLSAVAAGRISETRYASYARMMLEHCT
jgi:hypothetical protein